jgi:hypothetical protein
MEWISSHFHLTSPLYFLFLVPFIFFFIPRKKSRNRKGLVALPDAKLLWSSVVFPRAFKMISMTLLSVGTLCLVIALVSPGIPKTEIKPALFSQYHRDIVAVVDASGSMTISVPNETGERAQGETPFAIEREALRSLCQNRPNDRFALVIFSDIGPYFARSFTNDCEQLVAPLEGDIDDKTSLISQFSSGTDIAEALVSVPFLFTEGTSSSKLVLLFSDLGHGGSDSEVIRAITFLDKKGFKIYIVGILPQASVASAIKSYTERSPHVRLFEINTTADVQKVNRAIEALDPSTVTIVQTETVSIQEVNRVFLWIALVALVCWVALQLVVRRIF